MKKIIAAFDGLKLSQSIDSISFNPDAIVKGIENINKAEKETLLHKLAEIVF